MNSTQTIISSLIITLLIICTYSISTSADTSPAPYLQLTSPCQHTTLSGDELDQSQTVCTSYGWVGRLYLVYEWNNISLAQSFIPQKDVLTRVEILCGKNWSATCPLWLSIRSSLQGANLAVAQQNASMIVNYPNMSWIEFDFTDILVNPGTTYYMILNTTNVTDNIYWIGGDGDAYQNGTGYAYGYILNEWQDMLGDLCFKTYGTESINALEVQLNGGLGVRTTILNNGTVTLSDLDYNITIEGGFFGFIHKTMGGVLPSLPSHEKWTTTSVFLGCGPLVINIRVEGRVFSAHGYILLFYVILMQ